MDPVSFVKRNWKAATGKSLSRLSRGRFSSLRKKVRLGRGTLVNEPDLMPERQSDAIDVKRLAKNRS